MDVVSYIFDRSHQEPNTGCWLWDGAIDRSSVPMARIDGHTRSVARVVFESLGGKAGPGVSVIPKCGQRACVNPDHLVPRKKNSHRVIGWTPERIAELSVDGPGECKSWSGSLLNGRYGAASVGGRSVSAHRTAYTVFFGEIPAGMCVLHRCDNPRCVNPNHLFLGTQEENIEDMIEKGRDNFFGRGTSSRKERLCRASS